jgi:hypothetical protein
MGPISQERSFSHCSEKTLDRSGFLASISNETFMIADSAVVYKPKPPEQPSNDFALLAKAENSLHIKSTIMGFIDD